MRVRRFLAAFGWLMFSSFAGHAATLENQQIGNWLVGAYSNDQTGKFSHCAMTASYQSGNYMTFSVGSGFTWSMGFANPLWKLTPGASYDLVYSIDGGAPNAARATAIANFAVEIPLRDSRAIFERFRRGYQLTVTAAGQVFYFNLTGTAAGLNTVLQCVQRHVFQVQQQPSTSNPFVASNGSNAHSASTKAEAVALVANVLSAAGISGFRILPTEEVPKELTAYDVVWAAPDIFGVEFTILPTAGVAADQIPGSLIASDAHGCKGRFLSGSVPDDGATSSEIKRIFTGCEVNANVWTVYYTIVPRSSGGEYVFAEMGTGAAKEPVRQAESQIRQAAFKVLHK